MTRDVVSPALLQKILNHPKVKRMNTQSVRNAISGIHKKNHGITMNAAAYTFAKKKGFEVYRYLSPEDKQSLRHLMQEPVHIAVKPEHKRKIRSVDVTTDFDTPFVNEANDNAGIYPHVYILENSLRRIIFDKFANKQNWWTDKSIVHEDIQNYATKIMQAEKKYPWLKDRGNHPMYYVSLFELFKIIERNWKPHFSDVFDDLELLRAWIKESVPIRNLVAHNIKTRPEERQNIKIKTDYVCRLIEKWYAKQSAT